MATVASGLVDMSDGVPYAGTASLPIETIVVVDSDGAGPSVSILSVGGATMIVSVPVNGTSVVPVHGRMVLTQGSTAQTGGNSVYLIVG